MVYNYTKDYVRHSETGYLKNQLNPRTRTFNICKTRIKTERN